jgi:hypothetical protein
VANCIAALEHASVNDDDSGLDDSFVNLAENAQYCNPSSTGTTHI